MDERCTIPRWLVFLTRVFLGASLIFSDHGAATSQELPGFLAYATKNGFQWYAAFLKDVVIPRTALFGTLVVVGELYAGIAMVLGFTTRLAAVVALFLFANYLCAKGRLPWTPVIDASDIVLSLVVLCTAAGRVLGIDEYLHRRFPRVLFW